ncbi:hypothetical protein DERP_008567 [Dermatophagoides pteronyssinus]|uniref:Uncharacterized protein n=1 Tax=Dermatophagoides pteronyssinus TaxID=6956 RepID=A0ABQ8IWN8_DERPT|nr:hypothetical protein DERP_008567 [Dermatophagoides pteronyssinus]
MQCINLDEKVFDATLFFLLFKRNNFKMIPIEIPYFVFRLKSISIVHFYMHGYATELYFSCAKFSD